MRGTLPSRTALAVAWFRATATHRGVDVDPFAPALLPWPLGAAAGQLRRLRSSRWDPMLSALHLGLDRHVALRTHAIDAAMRAHATQVDQVVIVGAGLDTRATRLDALQHLPVWEVDHPATQSWKRARGAGRATLVTADLAREDLGDALDRAGVDGTRRTMWLWEGVTMYLPPAATSATLATMANRSPAGSMLLVTYAQPELSALPAWLLPLSRWAFRVLDEPLVGATSSAVFAAIVEDAGFEVVSDTGDAAWALAHDAPAPRWEIHERLVVAARI